MFCLWNMPLVFKILWHLSKCRAFECWWFFKIFIFRWWGLMLNSGFSVSQDRITVVFKKVVSNFQKQSIIGFVISSLTSYFLYLRALFLCYFIWGADFQTAFKSYCTKIDSKSYYHIFTRESATLCVCERLFCGMQHDDSREQKEEIKRVLRGNHCPSLLTAFTFTEATVLIGENFLG